MTSHINRIAAGVLAVLTAVAVLDVSRLRADEFETDIVATTCGAGTLKECGQEAIETCDWDIAFNINPTQYSFGFHVKKTNCRVTGYKPIYKDNQRGDLTFKPNCNMLNPFLGLPSGCE